MERLRIASRGSALALAQSRAVAESLRQAWPDRDLDIETVIVRTRGDAVLDRPVAQIGQGVFVTEVQTALLEDRADLAVHSYKDLPTAPTPGLVVAAVPRRADPRDALITRGGRALQYLPEGSRIGTGSGRRGGQLLRRRPDLAILPLRGNVDTRLAQLETGDYDGIILAAAGLRRLGLAERITECFDVDQMIPAPAQGALALEVREGDSRLREILAPLHDEPSAYAVLAERSCLAALGGGCSVPIGIHALLAEGRMTIFGVVLTVDGTRTARMRWSGPMREAREIGETLAALLVSIGADRIIGGEPMPPTVRFANRPPKDFVDSDEDVPLLSLRPQGLGTNGAGGKG
ncbi:MAG: hydroxymethylbilane synthase [Anaerolineae bacterium]